MIRLIFRALAPGGRRGRLSILIFHRVFPQRDPLFPGELDAQRFDELLGWISRWFRVLPLDDALARLASGALPSRAAAITFDDGYADNHAVALPLLRRHALPATFFIATGFLDGGRMWNDTIIEAIRHCSRSHVNLEALGLGRFPTTSISEKRAAIDALIHRAKYLPGQARITLSENVASIADGALPASLMMTSSEVRAVRDAGMQIGAHTVSHPILAGLSIEDAYNEMAESKAQLEDLLRERVGLFAYPNGKLGTDYLPEHAELARRIGFDAAFSTDWGTASSNSDPMHLPRFTPWDRGRLSFAGRLARNLLRSSPAP